MLCFTLLQDLLCTEDLKRNFTQRTRVFHHKRFLFIKTKLIHPLLLRGIYQKQILCFFYKMIFTLLCKISIHIYLCKTLLHAVCKNKNLQSYKTSSTISFVHCCAKTTHGFLLQLQNYIAWFTFYTLLCGLQYIALLCIHSLVLCFYTTVYTIQHMVFASPHLLLYCVMQ